MFALACYGVPPVRAAPRFTCAVRSALWLSDLCQAARVFADFAQVPAAQSHTYPLAGPDGIALATGYVAVAEYGEGRVHVFERNGRHLKTLKVDMPFVDTVCFDDAGNLYAGGAFQNTQPPFEGMVVKFAPGDWGRR